MQSRNLVMAAPGRWSATLPAPAPAEGVACRRSSGDLVDQAVGGRLVGREPGVPVGVVVDALDRLPGRLGQEGVEAAPEPEHLLGGALEVGRLALELPAPRLVDQDAGVRGGP